MTRFHLINGERVAFTAEEETARDTEEAASIASQAATAYIRNRRDNYPRISDQLDQLFRDVDSGKFGDNAKTGEWYIAVKAVKDANPKP